MEHRNLTISSGSSSPALIKIWELPEILLYHIAQFVSPPTKRASFFCQKIAPLCKAAYQSILTDEGICVELWDLVLRGDYGRGKNNRQDDDGRRSSKRLKRSPAHIVKEAHKLMIVHTEIAYGAVWELSYSSKKNAMTKQKLVKILNEFGPRLMINRTMGTGGNFIVEICRCRNTSPNNILLCVKELVRRGALVNIPTEESTEFTASSSLTALCVASVRGMPKVVKYLLSNENGSHSSSIHIKCSGRFRLHMNPRKTVRCIDTIPLDFCIKMLTAEKEAGATTQDLKDLNHCIKLLKEE
jgi:hypothetical protein